MKTNNGPNHDMKTGSTARRIPSERAAPVAIIGAIARSNRDTLLGFVFPCMVSLI